MAKTKPIKPNTRILRMAIADFIDAEMTKAEVKDKADDEVKQSLTNLVILVAKYVEDQTDAYIESMQPKLEVV